MASCFGFDGETFEDAEGGTEKKTDEETSKKPEEEILEKPEEETCVCLYYTFVTFSVYLRVIKYIITPGLNVYKIHY